MTSSKRWSKVASSGVRKEPNQILLWKNLRLTCYLVIIFSSVIYTAHKRDFEALTLRLVKCLITVGSAQFHWLLDLIWLLCWLWKQFSAKGKIELEPKNNNDRPLESLASQTFGYIQRTAIISQGKSMRDNQSRGHELVLIWLTGMFPTTFKKEKKSYYICFRFPYLLE